MKAEIALRQMTLADLPFADSVRALAGWNQTIADWKRFLAASTPLVAAEVRRRTTHQTTQSASSRRRLQSTGEAPSNPGCFVAEWNGSPAGLATTICYGEELAWIGMVLVHPEFRRRGIGRALLTGCVEWLRAHGITCIKLDATPDGKRLYDQLGFQVEWPLTRWENPRWQGATPFRSDETRLWEEPDTSGVEELDRNAFGAARKSLLKALLRDARRALVCRTSHGLSGFGLLREGSRAHYLGPLAAASPQCAAVLVNALLAQADGKPVYWDIPDPNIEAVALAKNLGFTAQRPLVRMFLGINSHPGDPNQYFAIADPSLG